MVLVVCSQVFLVVVVVVVKVLVVIDLVVFLVVSAVCACVCVSVSLGGFGGGALLGYYTAAEAMAKRDQRVVHTHISTRSAFLTTEKGPPRSISLPPVVLDLTWPCRPSSSFHIPK